MKLVKPLPGTGQILSSLGRMEIVRLEKESDDSKKKSERLYHAITEKDWSTILEGLPKSVRNMYLQEMKAGRLSSKLLQKAIDIALKYREQARTFRSKVGIAFVMYDGNVMGGFNIETYAHKGYHAEEVGLIRALAEGYNGVDFVSMVEVFQDAGHDEIEIFPACGLSCWGYLWEFTHPDLEIIVCDTKGNVHYKCLLKDIVHPPAPGQVFPSDKIRQLKPKMNSEPKSLRKVE